MEEKNKGTPTDYSVPLKNKKHELFCINLLTMKPSEAYTEAGYKQTGKHAKDSASRLLTANDSVLARYRYLSDKHNLELEEKGFISRERMLKNGLHMLNATMGKVPIKMAAKHREHEFKESDDGSQKATDFHEYYTEEDVQCYDIKSFTPLWDKLMNAFDYYPKENEVDISDPIYLAQQLKKLPKEKLEVLMDEFSKDD